jgi:hypothetical protein
MVAFLTLYHGRFAHIFMPVEEVGIGSHAHGVQAKHLFFLSFAFSSPGCRL